MGLPVLKLGLVGAMAETARETLGTLLSHPRLHLSEIYDGCLSRAQAQAHQVDATFSPNLDGLFRRTEALVIADVGWMGTEPMIRAARRQLPMLVLSEPLCSFTEQDINRLACEVDDTRTLLLPALAHRWARSTLRLRELIATQAGAIEQLSVVTQAAIHQPAACLLFDWCSNVMQSECRSVLLQPETGEVILRFRRLGRAGNPVQAVVRFQPGESSLSFPIHEAKATCRHGRIHLIGEQTLNWEIDRHKASESLLSDRSAADVMVDLFARRLVGGLVPIPEISDLLRAHAIHRACRHSLESRQETPVVLHQSA